MRWARRHLSTGMNVRNYLRYISARLTLAFTIICFFSLFGLVFDSLNGAGGGRLNDVTPSLDDVIQRQQLVADSPDVCRFQLEERKYTLRGSRLGRDLVNGSKICPHVRRPAASSWRTEDKWQRQTIDKDQLVVYSAFYDDRPNVGVTPWVRVIGVANLANRTHYCHVWYPECNAPYVTPVVVNVTGRDYGYGIGRIRYVQYLFSCRLPGIEPIPSHVSVVPEKCCSTSTIYLPIERAVRAEPDYDFGACVAIAFGSIPVPVFVEWIELTRMLGVAEFHVYDAGMVNMAQVFDYYTKRGWLTVHSMPPPVPDIPAVPKNINISTNGSRPPDKKPGPSLASVKLASPASLNDCLQRNAYRYRYLVVIDFDEVIVPRFHSDYSQMIRHIDSKYRLRDRPYTYTFQNTWYFLTFKQDETQPKYMRSLRYRRRVNPVGMASKSFVDPRACLSVFNHYCLRPLRAPSTTLIHIHVSPDIARSHHYRHCNFSNQTCHDYFKQETQDDVTLRFKRNLQPAVEAVLAELGWRT